MAVEAARGGEQDQETNEKTQLNGDFSWVVGNTREVDFPMDGKIFSPEFLFDTNYTYDFAHPKDHTLTGSTSSERSDEFEVEHIGVGGDFHVDNVRGRIMTEFGGQACAVARRLSPGSRAVRPGWCACF